MENIVVKTNLVDHLECDMCEDDYTEDHIFLICKWDTEEEGYYLSEILCPTCMEE